MADENGNHSEPRTIKDLEFIYVAGRCALGAPPTKALYEFLAAVAAVERAAAEKALTDAADDVDARWEDTGLGAVGASWLRARAAAEYRREETE